MRRPLLVSLILLGLVVTGIGGMGVFAPFTDRATTGVNDVTTGERPRAADLKLAWSVNTPDSCAAAYADDSVTPGHSSTDAQPGFGDDRLFCLKNAGSATLNVSVSVIDLVDVDIACTGDEEAAGDTTCGSDGQGEASTVLFVRTSTFDCDTFASGTTVLGGFLSSPTPMDLGSLAPNAELCGFVELDYPQNLTDEQELIAQSDQVTWKYAFDGTT